MNSKAILSFSGLKKLNLRIRGKDEFKKKIKTFHFS